MMYRRRWPAICLLGMVLFMGCSLKLEPLWNEAAPDNPNTQSLQKLNEAKELFDRAGDANSLKLSIAA